MTVSFKDLFPSTQNTLIQMRVQTPECLAKLCDQDLEPLLTIGGKKGEKFAAYLDSCRDAYSSTPQEIPHADDTLPEYAFSNFSSKEKERLMAVLGTCISPKKVLGIKFQPFADKPALMSKILSLRKTCLDGSVWERVDILRALASAHYHDFDSFTRAVVEKLICLQSKNHDALILIFDGRLAIDGDQKAVEFKSLKNELGKSKSLPWYYSKELNRLLTSDDSRLAFQPVVEATLGEFKKGNGFVYSERLMEALDQRFGWEKTTNIKFICRILKLLGIDTELVENGTLRLRNAETELRIKAFRKAVDEAEQKLEGLESIHWERLSQRTDIGLPNLTPCEYSFHIEKLYTENCRNTYINAIKGGEYLDFVRRRDIIIGLLQRAGAKGMQQDALEQDCRTLYGNLQWGKEFRKRLAVLDEVIVVDRFKTTYALRSFYNRPEIMKVVEGAAARIREHMAQHGLSCCGTWKFWKESQFPSDMPEVSYECFCNLLPAVVGDGLKIDHGDVLRQEQTCNNGRTNGYWRREELKKLIRERGNVPVSKDALLKIMVDEMCMNPTSARAEVNGNLQDYNEILQ